MNIKSKSNLSLTEKEIQAEHAAIRAMNLRVPFVDYDPILEDEERRRAEAKGIRFAGD